MRKFVFAVFVAVSVLFPLLLDAKTTEEKIQDLEQTLGHLQTTYMQNNQDTASAIASARMMQDEWGVMKGKVDANTQLIGMQHSELVGMITELDHRIQAIEDRMQIFSSQLSKALAKISPETAAEGDLYQKGLDLINQAKYLEAAATFEQFLKKYKNSQFAPSAMLWVGESFYSMRDYKRAIKEYQGFIEKYPRDKNVATAIVNQGSCFYELGMLEEAKVFYQKVIQTYPASTAAALAKERMTKITEKQSQAAGQPSADFGSYPNETLEQKKQRMSGEPQAPEKEPQKDKSIIPDKTIGDF
jgi:tol-pal system protein YbgF